MPGLALFVALVGVLAAIAFFLSARTAKAALAARTASEAKLARDIEAARTAEKEARAEAKQKREEASAFKADLDKAKRKAFEQQESAKKLGGAHALREELDRVAARLAEARSEAEHQAVRVRTLEKDLAIANSAVERLKTRAEPKVPAATPAPVASAPAAPAEPADDGKLAAEKERADKAEVKLVEARKKLAEVEAALKNARGRLETERRVYIVQKGELELAADRYAELRRRHDALRRDHEELVEAVRQAAREERRLTAQEAARATTPAPAAASATDAQADARAEAEALAEAEAEHGPETRRPQ